MGKILIVCAPSGTGKSTIISHLMEQGLPLRFSVSCTSRPPRGQEQDGVEYYFITEEEFRRHIAAGDFLEYCEVYAGRFYGTLRSEVDTRLERGENVVLDLDVIGGENIKRIYGDRAMSLYILPPSIAELRRRLEARGTDTPEVINDRIARAEFELSHAKNFDTCVVNDDLATAKAEAFVKVRNFLEGHRPKRTVVFGGSFNPLHNAHLELAREVVREGLAEDVWLMVSPQNPLKDTPTLLDEQKRLELCQRAVAEDEGRIHVCDLEFNLPRPSYTWNTLQELRRRHPERDFSLLVGADSAQNFLRWYRASDILATTPLIVYPRSGYNIPDELDTMATRGIKRLQAPLRDISSTDLRRMVREGKSIRGLVPDAICDDVETAYSNVL